MSMLMVPMLAHCWVCIAFLLQSVRSTRTAFLAHPAQTRPYSLCTAFLWRIIYSHPKDRLTSKKTPKLETMEPLHEEEVISPYEKDGTLSPLGTQLYNIGRNLLPAVKLGVVILSGGEGTRLRFDSPKGLFPIENKTLFEWHLETIAETYRKYNTEIYLFVMTSDSTHEAVAEYFSSKKYVFLKDVEIFKQDSIQALSIEGKTPLFKEGKPVMSPQGNGDFYKAIQKTRNKDKVDAFNVISVDNVVARMIDEVFVGAFFSYELEILSKAVLALKNESVGAFFTDGEKTKIIEYNEKTTKSGKSLFGNICNHFFSADFVKRMGEEELPFHEAHKIIPYTNDKNQTVSPLSPNGIKREKFIFDSFDFSTKNKVMCVKREKEFSPLKNSNLTSSVDNVDTCTKALRMRLVE